MKSFSLFFLFLTISSWTLAQQTINASITHDGLQRDYILYVPANYSENTAVPLVLNFHGYTSNASAQMGYGNFRPIADSVGFLIVHPEGTLLDGKTHWNVGGWTLASTVDDVGFTEALIDQLATDYNINLDRVYSTGMSNGGYMSFLLACQLSNKIAAIASVTGSMTPQTFNNCNPQHATPVLQIHGTNDDVVPYNGASWTKSISDVMQYWIDYNHCGSGNTSALPNTNTTDGSTIEQTIYQSCDIDNSTIHYKVIGGGHKWPGIIFGGQGTNLDMNATAEIWKFFSQYDINGLISITSTEDIYQNSKTNIYPNPSQSTINIETSTLENVQYEIFSTSGKLMNKGIIDSNNQNIDITDLPPNVYLLKIKNETHKILIMR